MFLANQVFTVTLTMAQVKDIKEAPIEIKKAQNQRDIAQAETLELLNNLKFLA